MGLLARVDRGALIRYCTYWADWVDLDSKLRSTGLIVRANHRPGLAANPLARMRSDVATHLLELSRQLLLTPSSRVRAGVEHLRPDPNDARERRAELASIDAYRARLAASTEGDRG
jgi:P27 family predicted phage terminase small subunit